MWNSNSFYTRGSDIKAYVKVYVTAWLWKMSEDFPITNISGHSLQEFNSICDQNCGFAKVLRALSFQEQV